jgi:3-isopropylmalate/(R)-2-methylmalate dehydratase small subunit
LPPATIEQLFRTYANRETFVTTDLTKQVFSIQAGDTTEEVKFPLADFDRALVEAGGWVEYADSNY